MAKIISKVERITADRTNYKQYSPQLAFDRLLVELEVPDGEVLHQDETGACIITLKGFTVLLDTVATAVDNMHDAYKRKFQ